MMRTLLFLVAILSCALYFTTAHSTERHHHNQITPVIIPSPVPLNTTNPFAGVVIIDGTGSLGGMPKANLTRFRNKPKIVRNFKFDDPLAKDFQAAEQRREAKVERKRAKRLKKKERKQAKKAKRQAKKQAKRAKQQAKVAKKQATRQAKKVVKQAKKQAKRDARAAKRQAAEAKQKAAAAARQARIAKAKAVKQAKKHRRRRHKKRTPSGHKKNPQ